MNNKINILILDDSATVRTGLKNILAKDKEINIIAAVSNPIIAMKWISETWPDLIITDIELPKMDGITFMNELKEDRPIKFIIFTSIDPDKINLSLKKSGLPPTQIIEKPQINIKGFLDESGEKFLEIVRKELPSKKGRSENLKGEKPAVSLKIRKHLREKAATPKYSPDKILPAWNGKIIEKETDRIVALGASAGGIKAIEEVLMMLPEKSPGIVVVQHLPGDFTGSFSMRLNNLCKVAVKEAEDGDSVKEGNVLIAPGNRHIILKNKGNGYSVELLDGPLITRHRPSVDVLFRSAALCGGKNIMGVLLTGMGDDGASEMLTMHNAGSYTVAQNEETCTVFGMPAEAIRMGGVDTVLPLDKIAGEIMKFYQGKIHGK